MPIQLITRVKETSVSKPYFETKIYVMWPASYAEHLTLCERTCYRDLSNVKLKHNYLESRFSLFFTWLVSKFHHPLQWIYHRNLLWNSGTLLRKEKKQLKWTKTAQALPVELLRHSFRYWINIPKSFKERNKNMSDMEFAQLLVIRKIEKKCNNVN